MMIIKKKNIIIISTILVLALIMVCNLSSHIHPSVQINTKISEYEILVDVEESKLYIFQNKELINTYKCSRGKMVDTITNRNLENNKQGKMGRRIWTAVGWD